MSKEEFSSLVEEVESHYKADIFLYFGPMLNPDDHKFQSIARKGRNNKNCLVMICTPGGDAHVAYRIGRALQRAYAKRDDPGKVLFYVHSVCKSAGTILALAADEIIMSQFGELGPIDVQLRKPDEVGERISGLTPQQALETLQVQSGVHFNRFFRQMRFGEEFSTKLAADLSVNLTIGLMDQIYAQIDPNRLGENERLVRISSEYGVRLASGNVRDGALSKLAGGYPSHEFVIDRREARESLFHSVSKPIDALEQLGENVDPGLTQDLFTKSSLIKWLNDPRVQDDDRTTTGGGDSGGEVAADGQVRSDNKSSNSGRQKALATKSGRSSKRGDGAKKPEKTDR